MNVKDRVEAVIVGAGAAGSLYAAALAAGGRRVVVLEAGAPWQLTDLVSSQIWARRVKWAGPQVIGAGANPVGHNLITGSGLGGAALHHYGTWPRMHPETFELASRFGRGRNWGIGYDALRRYYDRVQVDVGISGDAAAESWRPPGAPYPMPPLAVFAQGQAIRRGFDALGLPVAPLPAAINSVDYQGRSACLYDGWCDAGCPIGALANPLVTYQPRALAAGATFLSGCEVTRVLSDARGHATGVEYHADGAVHVQPADVVILAASVVQNARLLLGSASEAFPGGLGNSSGLVGTEIATDFIAQIYGLFPDETEPHLGVSAGQLMHWSPHQVASRATLFGAYQWQLAPAMKPNDIFGIAISRADLFGAPLQAFVRRAARHIGCMLGFGMTEPDPGKRIVLDDSRDRYGARRARFEHAYSGADTALRAHMIEEGKRIFARAGASGIWSGPMVTGHLAGGTRMGEDPRTSVTDSYGRCHDVRNLVIAGAGLFPQTGGTSPTFTIHAVSLRGVEHLLAHWSDYTP
ncbi:MAG: GMC family oxidoreductase [Gammaproteobacteria bacterium]|nr:GMC family oxidoreductase [Gammaproteobacteria bacterium]